MRRTKMLSLLTTFVFLIPQQAFAGDILAEKERYYYGADIEKGNLTLKTKIHNIINGYHISKQNDFDEIVDHCHINENARCYSHIRHGYKTARKYLFGQLHLEGEQANDYSVTTYYCLSQVSNDELPVAQSLGPMKIPSAQIINTEHAWPQSKFTSAFSKSLQKSDLHALFPVIMHVNSTRGNSPYGIVKEVRNAPCDKSKLGKNKEGQIVFEPADEVKGDVARATFYFATRYKMNIDTIQEDILRQWHKDDPVDQNEKIRNEEIFDIQHVRNPYIDHPEWVAKIENF